MNFQRTNTKIPLIEDYYNHFDEDKRLQRKHGQVEYQVNMHYINKYLNNDTSKRILDIGAGTGAYSIPLFNKGYNVEAIELCEANIIKFKKNNPSVNVRQGNALDLSYLKDNTYDLIILFGPMYHLLKKEEKLQALKEAKRLVKDDGIILVSYYMNDYAIINYGFMKGNIKASIEEGRIDENFHVVSKEDDLYSFMRLEDIEELNKELNLKRINIFASDGASDYMRTVLNKLSDEDFEQFVKYNLTICERKELLGASSHVVDVLMK